MSEPARPASFSLRRDIAGAMGEMGQAVARRMEIDGADRMVGELLTSEARP